MSTVQDRKPPSAGTKVDVGQGAPVAREGAGAVPSESLAAESCRDGGGFAQNRNAQPEALSSSDLRSSTGSTGSQSQGFSGSNGGAAPSYAAGLKDKSGPHGKNLMEGFDDSRTHDGLRMALQSEPGSEDDPSRLAEAQFRQGQNVRGRDAGERQSALTKETKYDALDRETSS